jgi:phosphoribosylformylglycinamidine synthase I
MKARALILHAAGTNRDLSVAHAFELAGASGHIIPLADLKRQGAQPLKDFDIFVIPGGFSYGDVLGAGRLLALDLQTYFSDVLHSFVAGGKPVLGICNGFQALVKAGLLPGLSGRHEATLTFNASGSFVCKWVSLTAPASNCLWTRGFTEDVTAIDCPIAHGEGRFVVSSDGVIAALKAQKQIALQYAPGDNPNGSAADIAGICNVAGNVLGLMPHPEDHVFAHQYPGFTRRQEGKSGLALFRNAVTYVS